MANARARKKRAADDRMEPAEAGAAAEAPAEAAAAAPPQEGRPIAVCRELEGGITLAGEVLETLHSDRFGRLYLIRYEAAYVHAGSSEGSGGAGSSEKAWYALGEDACSELALHEDAVRLEEAAAGAPPAPRPSLPLRARWSRQRQAVGSRSP